MRTFLMPRASLRLERLTRTLRVQSKPKRSGTNGPQVALCSSEGDFGNRTDAAVPQIQNTSDLKT